MFSLGLYSLRFYVNGAYSLATCSFSQCNVLRFVLVALLHALNSFLYYKVFNMMTSHFLYFPID